MRTFAAMALTIPNFGARELEGFRTHGTAKLAGGGAIAALEQPVEMRNVPEPRGERDFRNRFRPVRGIEQIAGAGNKPPLVDVFSDRLSRGGKQPVHIAR